MQWGSFGSNFASRPALFGAHADGLRQFANAKVQQILMRKVDSELACA